MAAVSRFAQSVSPFLSGKRFVYIPLPFFPEASFLKRSLRLRKKFAPTGKFLPNQSCIVGA
jgi:hypothetical protein